MMTARRHRLASGCLLLAAMLAGCQDSADSRAAASKSRTVAASNSYIETAAADLLGDNAEIIRLAEPGMCPGHFDIRPSQVRALRTCRLLLRFDFQEALDGRLSGLAEGGLAIIPVRAPGGLCEPSTYLDVCRQVAETFTTRGLLSEPDGQSALDRITRRMAQREAWCRERMEQSGWAGRPVVCSTHQEAFCRWLGLEVAATFSGADTASISEIERTVRTGRQARIDAVIANLPEGRRLADALGQQLGAQVVVFGNFPSGAGGHMSFDELLMANVNALAELPSD